MFKDEECVETLMGLGLTLLQAKTYLGLAKLGVANVKTISKVSNVARQDVYRITPKLQKWGLAEKIIANPTMYKAIPLKNGLLTLLQQKVEENADLQEKTHRLIEDFEENFNTEITIKENPAEFIITSEKSLFVKRVIESMNSAQKSKDAILTVKGFNAMLFNDKEHIKSALKRGVKFRIISEEPENPKATQDLLRDLKNPFFMVKYIPPPTPICMMIFDDEEVNLRMAEGPVPSFWSNNKSIVNLSTRYFNGLWHKIQEPNSPTIINNESIKVKTEKNRSSRQ
jgi:sugar-specific transcriptional regulator TrmB